VRQYHQDKQKGFEPQSKSEQGTQSNASPEANAERALMVRIYETWNGEIVKATRNSGVSAPFLAALTANESGGDPVAQAFEPEIFERLQAVVQGEQHTFGSIMAADLVRLAQEDVETEEASPMLGAVQGAKQFADVSPAVQEKVLRQMATSWGLTQIMGYETINRKTTVQDLLNPALHYEFAVELLEELSRRFRLNSSKDAGPLFRCWNTGHPNGETSDPDYVSRGIQRLSVYSAIVQPDSGGNGNHDG
jgi:hypothetical protein